jgi:uncharacterized protein (UPF0332 family)
VTEAQGQLIEEARQSIAAADLLLSEGYAAYSASRAYYAMFFPAEALLHERCLSYSTHSAVVAAFGRHFAKPGLLATRFHWYLIEGRSVRPLADYPLVSEVSAAQAQQQIERARELPSETERHLGVSAAGHPG